VTKERDYKEDCCEIELENEGKSFFLKVFFNPTEIFVDTQALTKTAFLCAACDGIASLQSPCGENNDIVRYFLPIDWVIDEWGGNKEIVEAVKKRKQMILDDIENLKRKCGVN